MGDSRRLCRKIALVQPVLICRTQCTVSGINVSVGNTSTRFIMPLFSYLTFLRSIQSVKKRMTSPVHCEIFDGIIHREESIIPEWLDKCRY